jgi:hypothetical protein
MTAALDCDNKCNRHDEDDELHTERNPRKAHLLLKRSPSLRPRTPVDGSGHLAHDVFEVLKVCH